MNKLVCFDLDGTLVNTSKGIFNSVRYAEHMLKLSPIKESELNKFVGPPPTVMYEKTYNLSVEDALKATGYHREYGREKGFLEGEVYKGIPELLIKIHEDGYKLAVTTLKNEKIAEKVLKNFQIFDFFDLVVGMDDAESLSKADTIKIAKKKLDCDNCILVGDSLYDYEGALNAKVDFLGVSYGFGLKEEENYSFDMVDSVKDIYEYIRKN